MGKVSAEIRKTLEAGVRERYHELGITGEGFGRWVAVVLSGLLFQPSDSFFHYFC
jgi:hypothetical protein